MYVGKDLPIEDKVKIIEMVVGGGLCPLLVAVSFNVELEYVQYLIKDYYGG